MSSFMEIFLTFIGVIMFVLIIYYMMELYRDYQDNLTKKGTTKSFPEQIKDFFKKLFTVSKRGEERVFSSTTKVLSEDVYDAGVAAGKDIEKGAGKTKEGAEKVLDSTTIPLAEDVERTITGYLGKDKESNATDSKSGKKTIGDKIDQGIENTKRGFDNVVDSSTRPLAEDVYDSVSYIRGDAKRSNIVNSLNKSLDRGIESTKQGLETVVDSSTVTLAEDVHDIATGHWSDDQKTSKNSGTRRPDNDDTRRPSHDDTRRPSHDDTRRPRHDGTRRPSHDDTRRPDNDDTRRPSHDDTRRPSHDGEKPINTHGSSQSPLLTDYTSGNKKGIKGFTGEVLSGSETVLDSTTYKTISDTESNIESVLNSLREGIFNINEKLGNNGGLKQSPTHTQSTTYSQPTHTHHTTRHTTSPTHPEHTESPTYSPSPEIPEEKEVFNVSQNLFTYEDAPLVCQAYGAELANYDQIHKAYQKGANWCNYGWSQNQMALYPIQGEFYDELQKGPESHREDCGHPGINGGYFKDKNMKFGVNCYGYKPKADPNTVQCLTPEQEKQIQQSIDNTSYSAHLEHKLNNIKNVIKEKHVSTSPWSSHKWSSGSTNTCKYIINQSNVVSTTPDDYKEYHESKETPPPIDTIYPGHPDHPETKPIPTHYPTVKPTKKPNLIGGCQGTRYGCCPDGETGKVDKEGSNCKTNEKCLDTPPLSEYVLVEETEI